MEYELELPVEIIQHIQSFLTPKEATQTCMLSKPWFKAWSTPPTLRLYQKDFRVGDAVSDEFWNFSRKSMQRYKDLNCKPGSLFLRVDVSLPSSSTPILDQLITDALDLGVNVLRLESRPSHGYVLPAQIFEAKSLTELSVYVGEINGTTRCFCSRLTSLLLKFVSASDQIVRDILLGSPFIENLELWICGGLTNVDVSKMRNTLVKLCVASEFDGLVRLQWKDLNVGGGRTRNVPEFRFLRRLELLRVDLDNEFFRDFSSRFPCVEYLYLGEVHGCVDLQISSYSLRYLRLTGKEWGKIQLNVPNISKFVINSGIQIPLLSFGTTAPRDLKSDVKLYFFRIKVIEDSWFVEFRKFLSVLSPSRISVRIEFYNEYIVSAEMIPRFPIPVVEELQLLVIGLPSWNMSPSMLRCLFWCCRPSFICMLRCLFWCCRPSFISSEDCVAQLLYEQLIRNENKDIVSMYNLEEVNLELFEENLMEWQTIPSEKLINAPEIPHEGQRIRFRLSWGPGGLTG